MQEVFPATRADVDPAEAYAADDRPAPDDRPWLLVNMVATVDGGTAVHGRSGGLGGLADRRVFSAIRGVADVVLVAAGTVRAEDYGPARTPHPLQERRVLRGQTPHPRIAVVTASLRLDLTSTLFTESDPTPLVITAPGADRTRRIEVAERADLLLAGQGERVDLPEALRALHELGARTVVAEGGPSLNGQLLADDLIDEVCLSLAPTLVGGDSARLVHGPDIGDLAPLALRRVLEEDGQLFLRYTRR